MLNYVWSQNTNINMYTLQECSLAAFRYYTCISHICIFHVLVERPSNQVKTLTYNRVSVATSQHGSVFDTFYEKQNINSLKLILRFIY